MIHDDALSAARPTFRALLVPQPSPWRYVALLAVGVACGALLIGWAAMPLWGASVLALTLIAWPTMQTWRTVGARFGVPLMVLSVLLYLQGFHTVEHIAQATEYHLLGWQPKQASGLISAANVEWIHFAWNWSVLVTVIYVMAAGRMRNVWTWLLLAWALAHTLEHTYLFVRYLAAVRLLVAQGNDPSFAQGLPGILGRGGWLGRNGDSNAALTFVCQLAPPLVTAIRLDIHFWWNIGETTLLLLATQAYLRRCRRVEARDRPPPMAPGAPRGAQPVPLADNESPLPTSLS